MPFKLPNASKKIAAYSQRYYNQRVTDYGNSLQALGWRTLASQQTRFDVIFQAMLAGQATRTLTDFGCGRGDFLIYLRHKNWPGLYTGVDDSQNMIKLAKTRLPTGKFRHGSVAAVSYSECIIASGVFSLLQQHNQAYLTQQIKLLCEKTDLLILNFLNATRVSIADQDPRLAYYNPVYIRHICRQFDPNTQLIRDYLPDDFTVILRTPGPDNALRPPASGLTRI
jgi:Trans-aconitate methyltransferase